ncbi:hypothetical protein MI149_29660 (plasmid) [Mycolicibacterium crocinum]|uniref:Uncharacterized protein n=1 Tax=Mycolicibacterium crocinum TaxID=388459 RepID=A0ABY3TV87_9MYCO|nr:hypothetical protein [Mycolicibacterium crocinum]ULN44847.1 hypothetical protein MI149_29660 [Mycolicibacterium crocinum]
MAAATRAYSPALSPISLGGNAIGMQLLSSAITDLIFREQANGIDQILAVPFRCVSH